VLRLPVICLILVVFFALPASGVSSSSFPRSFYTGPLGSENILPPKTTGAFLGLWSYKGGFLNDLKNSVRTRESQLHRKLDLIHVHWASPDGACDYGPGYSPFTTAKPGSSVEKWILRHGSTLVMSWSPGFTIDEVNQGAADGCFVRFGKKAAVLGQHFLLRPWWEFNGTWMDWSSKGQPFIDAWKRMVTKIKEGGGAKVGFIWSPSGGERDEAFVSYPGDSWVDWVGVSAYNFNKPGSWCNPYNAGPWCELREVLSYRPATYPTIYDTYASRKPFIISEWSSVEDPLIPGRKGQWFRRAGNKLTTELPLTRAVTLFDIDVTESEGFNFRLDTSTTSLDGFRHLANKRFFNTRPGMQRIRSTG